MFVVQGLINNKTGSATLTCKNTTVIATIKGPEEVDRSSELYDRAAIAVRYQPANGRIGCHEKLFSTNIKKILEVIIDTEAYPRSLITASLLILSENGNILSACINALNSALLDSGLYMKCQIIAVSICISNGILIEFPTDADDNASQFSLTIAFDSRNFEKALLIDMKGSCEKLEEIFAHCQNMAKTQITVLEAQS